MFKIQHTILLILFVLSAIHSTGQSSNATFRGIVTDQHGNPLDMVNIGLKDYPLGTSSNREGKFLLRIPADKKVVIVFKSLGYATVTDTVHAAPEEQILRDITLNATDLQLAEVV